MTDPNMVPGQYNPLTNPPMDTALLRTWEQTTPDDGHRQIYQRLRRAIEIVNADSAQIEDLNRILGDVQQLEERVAALEVMRIRGTTGSGSVTTLIAGTSNVTVNLKAEMPDANWIPFVWVDATSGVNLTNITATVVTKTATNATVRIANSGLGLAQTVNLTVLALSLT